MRTEVALSDRFVVSRRLDDWFLKSIVEATSRNPAKRSVTPDNRNWSKSKSNLPRVCRLVVNRVMSLQVRVTLLRPKRKRLILHDRI